VHLFIYFLFVKALTVAVAVVLTYYYTWPSLIELLHGAIFFFFFLKGLCGGGGFPHDYNTYQT
jgi:hypothetical protein